MRYLLDTNTCIRYLNGSSSNVFKRLNQLPAATIFVCSIVKFELRYGALRSTKIEQTLAEQEKFLRRFISLPFDEKSQLIAAQIRADLSLRGKPIGPYDVLIASIAMANDLILVTHNLKEFERVAGLKIEDWETD
jgi:tRNA(fMet)-specific endonuclease VapC